MVEGQHDRCKTTRCLRSEYYDISIIKTLLKNYYVSAILVYTGLRERLNAQRPSGFEFR